MKRDSTGKRNKLGANNKIKSKSKKKKIIIITTKTQHNIKMYINFKNIFYKYMFASSNIFFLQYTKHILKKPHTKTNFL